MKVMKDLSGELCKENIKIEYQDVFSKYANKLMNEEGQYINGSLKLLEELFCDEIDKLKIELIEKDIGKKNIFCSTRVGLQAHPLDYELLTKYKKNFIPYIFRLYRFIVDYSCPENKCKDKTKIAFYEHLKNKNKPRPNYKQDSIKEN